MISIEKIQELAQRYFNLTAQAKAIVSYDDLNFYLTTTTGQEFILKIAYFGQSTEVLDLQNKAMQHLDKAALDFQTPQVIPNIYGEDITTILLHGQTRLMRLLTWLPGKLWVHTHPHSFEGFENLGATCGAMVSHLQNFQHPSAAWHSEWDNAKANWLEKGLEHIPELPQRAWVQYFLDLYQTEAVPYFPSLRQSVIHNDINDYNIVVGKNEKVVGVFDFGDVIFTHTINELAISAAYANQYQPDPLTAMASMVKGFHQKYPLTEQELAVLFPLIAIRVCVSVTFSAIHRVSNPENSYIQISEASGWDLLAQLRQISPKVAHRKFQNAIL